MTRSAAFWLSALVISATAGTASAADQAIIRKAAAAPEATEYGNLYYGFDWNSHRSLVGYMGVLYAPFGGMDKSGLRVSAFGLGGDYRYHGDPGETFKRAIRHRRRAGGLEPRLQQWRLHGAGRCQLSKPSHKAKRSEQFGGRL
jgi:hypothetical protein